MLADGGLRLTDAITKNSNASAFWPTPVAGASNFTVNFDSTIDGGTNADGTTLTFGDVGAGAKSTSLGSAGGGLGWSGTPGFAVALDTYANGTDPSANFVGIATGREAATPKNLVWKATSKNTPELRTQRHIDVVASGGSIWVSVNRQRIGDRHRVPALIDTRRIHLSRRQPHGPAPGVEREHQRQLILSRTEATTITDRDRCHRNTTPRVRGCGFLPHTPARGVPWV